VSGLRCSAAGDFPVLVRGAPAERRRDRAAAVPGADGRPAAGRGLGLPGRRRALGAGRLHHGPLREDQPAHDRRRRHPAHRQLHVHRAQRRRRRFVHRPADRQGLGLLPDTLHP